MLENGCFFNRSIGLLELRSPSKEAGGAPGQMQHAMQGPGGLGQGFREIALGGYSIGHIAASAKERERGRDRYMYICICICKSICMCT